MRASIGSSRSSSEPAIAITTTARRKTRRVSWESSDKLVQIKEFFQTDRVEDSHPGNEGNHWNNEAGGVEDAIGDGAHLSGSLDAMMEPFTPKVDANSFFGGGGGDNTKAMAEAATEEMKEDEEDGKFDDWKPSNKWEYSEKDTATEHDRKTHLQQDENWENEETAMAREIGKRQREKKKKRREAKRASTVELAFSTS